MNRINKIRQLTKKTIILVAILIFNCISIGMDSYTNSELNLLQNEVYLEYVETFPDDLLDYVDLSNNEDSSDDVALLDVGDYFVDFQYRNTTKTLKIVVKDTTSSQLSQIKEIVVLENNTIH